MIVVNNKKVILRCMFFAFIASKVLRKLYVQALLQFSLYSQPFFLVYYVRGFFN